MKIANFDMFFGDLIVATWGTKVAALLGRELKWLSLYLLQKVS